jgi:HSP20 family protein
MSRSTRKSTSESACRKRRAPVLLAWAGSGWATVQNLSRDVNRLWRHVILGNGAVPGGPMWLPELDISEQADQILIRVDLPGVEPEQLRIERDECAVTLRGRRPETDHMTRGFRRYERRFGAFHRRIPLPAGAHIEVATATLRNGVLEIRVPVSQHAARRHSQIQTTVPAANAGVVLTIADSSRLSG